MGATPDPKPIELVNYQRDGPFFGHGDYRHGEQCVVHPSFMQRNEVGYHYLRQGGDSPGADTLDN